MRLTTRIISVSGGLGLLQRGSYSERVGSVEKSNTMLDDPFIEEVLTAIMGMGRTSHWI